jgi:hypothetical protein
MCSPSSNADRGVSISFDGENFPSRANLPGAEQFIFHHGTLLGPCAEWFIRTLWAQAAQQAYQDSLQLLEYAHRYTPQRLENACQRALLYHLEGLAALRFIFAEDLDRLLPRPDAELTGQLRFPFANS